MAISIPGTYIAPDIVDALNASIQPNGGNPFATDLRFGTYTNAGLEAMFDFPINAGATLNYAAANITKIPDGWKLKFTPTTTLNVAGNPIVAWGDLSMTNLETFSASGLTAATDLLNLYFPSTIQTITFAGSASLNDRIYFNTNGLVNISNVSFNGCALSQLNVSYMLQELVDLLSNGYVGTPGTLDFSGGTNAVPTAQGITNAGILSAAGFNVLINLPAVLDINSINQTGCSGPDQQITANVTISGYSNVNIQLYMSLSSTWMDGSMWSIPNFTTGNNSFTVPFGPGGPNFTQARLKDYTTGDTGIAVPLVLTVCP